MKGPKTDAIVKALREVGFVTETTILDATCITMTEQSIYKSDARSHRMFLYSNHANHDVLSVTGDHDGFRSYCESLLKSDEPLPSVVPEPRAPSPEHDYFTALTSNGGQRNIYYRWIDDLSSVGLTFRQPFEFRDDDDRWIGTRAIAYDRFSDELWVTSSLKNNVFGGLEGFSEIKAERIRRQ